MNAFLCPRYLRLSCLASFPFVFLPSLQVVREVYLPQSGLWLCEYPYVNRDLFVALSVGVERQRRAEAAAAVAALQYDT